MVFAPGAVVFAPLAVVWLAAMLWSTRAAIDSAAAGVTAISLSAYALPGGAGSDAHDPPGIGAAYLEMPDFDGPASFLAALADARITGEYRPHALRYPRRPAS